MQVNNMLDAKNRLSSLVAAAERGEPVILACNGEPVAAKIVKYEPPQVQPPGLWKGKCEVAADWDSAETNREVDKLFLGPDDAPAA